jgi:hypothetical protein
MIRTILFGLLLAIGISSSAYASESSGTILPVFKNAKVCHSVGCVTPTPGVINFKPTGTAAVTIDDTLGIDGVAWGNELGWITFDPTGPEGLTINTTTGVIGGKAWSQASGWINFAPTGQSVTVNSNGEFVGWAWTGGPQGGWIKFDCADAAACVKTDWRPLGSRTVVVTPTGDGGNGPVSGSGGGGGSPSDMCWNLAGIQFTVPVGYTQNGGNTCQVTAEPVASALDACINIPGVQVSVPAGYTYDSGGLCVTEASLKVNMLPNKMALNTSPRPVINTNVQRPTPQIQTQAKQEVVQVPEFIEQQPSEVPFTEPQLTEPSYTLPTTVDTRDPIVQKPFEQAVPSSMPAGADDIVHFTFIPSVFQIPIDAPAFREAFRTVLSPRIINMVLNDPAPDKPSKVDLVSLAVLIGGGSLVTFSTIYSVLKVVGLLASIL